MLYSDCFVLLLEFPLSQLFIGFLMSCWDHLTEALNSLLSIKLRVSTFVRLVVVFVTFLYRVVDAELLLYV